MIESETYSEYETYSEDYDIAAIEEEHITAGKYYGW